LRSFLLASLAAAGQPGAEERSSDDRFGMIASPTLRWDFLLDGDEPFVSAALADCCCNARLQAVYEATIGLDATLSELSGFVSAPGCGCQPLHRDTTPTYADEVSGGPDSAAPRPKTATLLTTFVALQDITLDMGPTVVLPGTHDFEQYRDAHSAVSGILEGRTAAVPLVLPAGSVAVMNSLTLHCGTSNTRTFVSEGARVYEAADRRAIFYFSLQGPGRPPVGSTESLLPKHSGTTLRDILDGGHGNFPCDAGLRRIASTSTK
jgi:hypothetical protein